jgi:hypothetical protein
LHSQASQAWSEACSAGPGRKQKEQMKIIRYWMVDRTTICEFAMQCRCMWLFVAVRFSFGVQVACWSYCPLYCRTWGDTFATLVQEIGLTKQLTHTETPDPAIQKNVTPSNANIFRYRSQPGFGLASVCCVPRRFSLVVLPFRRAGRSCRSGTTTRRSTTCSRQEA